MVQFTNTDVAAKYEACRANDGRIHIPAGKDKNGYAGPLSGITLAAADKAYASGCNVLKLKQEAKAPKEPKASANGSTLTT
jgi:hypothetical protein